MSDAADLADIFKNNHEIIVAAKRNLKQDDWDYICGAAETETSLRRNRQALDCLAFRPRILRDVTDVDTSSTFLGHKLTIPVMLAPMGGIQRMTEKAALAPDDAAEEFGTINFVSTVTDPELEVTAANSPHPKCFQIYVRGDDDWIRELVGRVKAAGYSMVTLTVDSAFYGNRERLNPAQMALRRVPERTWQKRLTWDTIKLIQDELDGIPFMIKGIMTGEDAALAVEHGVQAVYVSNHGGRQLDHVVGMADMLPEIVDAVGGKAEIIVDGAITRGTDVLKAIALGANAVAIGRLQAWALGAGGGAGLVRCLEILRGEVETAMGLLGVTRLDELNPSFVKQVIPTRWPHEMSAFPHLPEDRIL